MQVLASDARSAVMADRGGAAFPWTGAAGPTGLAALLANPRQLITLLLIAWWIYQWWSKGRL